jgi:hypothetical protein
MTILPLTKPWTFSQRWTDRPNKRNPEKGGITKVNNSDSKRTITPGNEQHKPFL